MEFKSKYGNERKDLLETYLSPELQARTEYVLAGLRFIVLNTSLWRCAKPWAVPERRISDNLIVFVMEGRLDVSANGYEGTVSRGDCVLIPEGAFHSYRFHKGCSECSLFILHALPLLPSAENPFSCFSSPFQRLCHPDAVFDALHRAVAMRNLNETAAFSYAAEILKGVFLEATARGAYRGSGTGMPSSRLGKAYVFMNGNFANDIGIGDIAQSVGLKEVQFRRLFKRETGLSPNAYLHRLRLLNAVRLLVRYEYGLADIASESGFHSTSYFCSSFLRFFKRTPGEFRQEFKP
jgi:AraC-like DNA-binding protein